MTSPVLEIGVEAAESPAFSIAGGAALLGAGSALVGWALPHVASGHSWAVVVTGAGACALAAGLRRTLGAAAGRAGAQPSERPRAATGAELVDGVLDVARLGCFTTDPDGVIRRANAPLHRLLGRAPGTLVGAAPAAVGLAPDGDRSVLTFDHPDGGARELELSSAPLLDDDGAVCGLATWVDDVTERNRTTRELEEARQRLRQSERLETLGTLAGGLAHDLNNLLTPIMGHVDLARLDLPEGSPLGPELDVVKSAATQATDLTRRLLHLARPERDQVEPISVQEVMHEVVALLAPHPGSGIRIDERLDAGCPPVLGTRTQLHQVLLNLCKNALHAMPDGGTLTVSVDLTEALATLATCPGGDGPFVRARVIDTGNGMDESTVGRIFEPFFTTKGEGRGSGLGLSMVRSIVDSLGGTITVDSALGRGTAFTLLFPAHQARSGVAEGPAASAPAERGGRENGRPAGHVLVVDDDAAVLDLLSRVLLRLGYQVTALSRSPEALEALRSDPDAYDLLLTDQMMPALTGLELLERVRDVRPDLPAVLTTGRADLVSSDQLERLGCSLLPKPASASQLDEAVSAGLALRVVG